MTLVYLFVLDGKSIWPFYTDISHQDCSKFSTKLTVLSFKIAKCTEKKEIECEMTLTAHALMSAEN